MNSYPLLFDKYLLARIKQLIRLVESNNFVHTPTGPNQLVHLLDYALKCPGKRGAVSHLLLKASPKMEQLGYCSEWIPYLQSGAEKCQLDNDETTAAELYLQLGILYRCQANYNHAFQALKTSEHKFKLSRNAYGQARSLNQQAQTSLQISDHLLAKHQANSASRLISSDDPEQANCHYILGELALHERSWVLAEKRFRQTLHFREQLTDCRLIGLGLLNLGRAYYPQQKYQCALTAYREAKGIFTQINDSSNLALTLMNEGVVFSLTNRSNEALDAYVSAETIFRLFDDKNRLAMVYTNLAIEYHNLRMWAQAESTSLTAIKYWEQLGNIASKINIMDELGTIYLDQHMVKQAEIVLSDALEELDQLHDHPRYARLHQLLSQHMHQVTIKKEGAL